MADDAASNNGRSSVLPWLLAIPALVLALGVCPWLLTQLRESERLFRDLKATLPDITLLMFQHGHWLLAVVPIALAVVLVVVLLWSASAMIRMVFATLILLSVGLIAAAAWVAMKYPLDELARKML